MEKHVKVLVSGKDLLPEAKRGRLEIELSKRGVEEVRDVKDADVVIVVIGSDSTRARCAKARDGGKPFFKMRAEMDSIFASSMIGEAILPEDAARWAWSIVNEPEKWRSVR